MHDINSTRLETSAESNTYGEYQELGEYQESGAYHGQGEASFEMPMTEAEEEALAAELLGVSSEMEMDQFLGGLFRKIGGAAKFLSKNAGPLAGALKGLAGKALPFLGGALGTAIPIPGVGTALGAAVGQAASKFLQSETESLELEEQEFETARRYVQLASQAIRQASRIPPRGNPYAAANFALRNALRRLRGAGRYRPRPTYVGYSPYAAYPLSEPCPPCPVCPTCAQAVPTADTSQQPLADTPPQAGAGSVSASSAGGSELPSGEFQFEEEFGAGGGELPSGEFQFEEEFGGVGERGGEGEYYETDHEFLTDSGAGRGHSGRWVRHGRKIILHGL
jgi:hypothetical protein